MKMYHGNTDQHLAMARPWDLDFFLAIVSDTNIDLFIDDSDRVNPNVAKNLAQKR